MIHRIDVFYNSNGPELQINMYVIVIFIPISVVDFIALGNVKISLFIYIQGSVS